jgi:hypothetical protein
LLDVGQHFLKYLTIKIFIRDKNPIISLDSQGDGFIKREIFTVNWYVFIVRFRESSLSVP